MLASLPGDSHTSGSRSCRIVPRPWKHRKMIHLPISGRRQFYILQTHKEIITQRGIWCPQFLVFLADFTLLRRWREARRRRNGSRASGFVWVAVGNPFRGRHLLASTSGEWIPVGGDRVIVLCSVGNNEHSRVGSVSLHLFSGQTSLWSAASVITPVDTHTNTIISSFIMLPKIKRIS